MSVEQLALDIYHGKVPLFITGAGLSVASGISPYRGAKNAIWNTFVTDWATKGKFFQNPLIWWNEFWLRTHETPQFLQAEPNAGHDAIAWMVKKLNSKVITQNIDQLHPRSGVPTANLVEIHGRLTLYRCLNKRCKYSKHQSIRNINLDALAEHGTSLDQGNLKLRTPPSCPCCSSLILPQSLLFDEDYDSHKFYKAEIAEEWFEQYDLFIFVGTSFSVGITRQALEIAKSKGKTVYNFNLYQEAMDIDVEATHILGRAEKTLPKLAKKLNLLLARPRIWYYRPPVSEYMNHVRIQKSFVPSLNYETMEIV